MSAANLPSALLSPAPGPHPDADTLRRYAAGTLDPAGQHRVEAHTLDCERCAELLEGFGMSDAPTTDRAIATLRSRLRERVGEAQPVAGARPLWPRVAAAAAVLAVAAGGIWGWEQLTPTPETAAIRTEAPAPAAPVSPAAPDVALNTPAAEPAPAVTTPAPSRPAAPVTSIKPRAARPAQARRTVPAPEPATTTLAAASVPVAEQPAAGRVAPTEPAPDLTLNTATADKADTLQAEEAKNTADVAASAKAKRMAKTVAADEGPRPAAAMPAGPSIAPAPMGGTVAWREYLRRSATQFDPVINAGRLSGSVHVRFTVGEDGRISNVKVTRGLRPDYNAEAQRIICEGPAWQPGIANGRRSPLTVDAIVPF